ncbi:MAG: hypothetical protein GKR93_13995 [Gammaproteobacteria bacterium]|nr:hypothetical protein [Gammaproteobacteria bacterium]
MDIVLLAPALLDAEGYFDAEGVKRFDALEMLLSRASKSIVTEESLSALLANQFAYTQEPDRDIPIAAIGRLIDDEKRPEAYWIRADPVHLRADQKSLNLLDVSYLSLTQHDALAIAAVVQPSFSELGWELEVPVPSRWYLKLDKKPAIRTTELHSVLGKDIQSFMPFGEDAPTWHRLMNEIQMRLHNADINTMRSERGELAVNSLWPWGGGCLPDLLERKWSRVYSDENCTMGFSMLSNTPCLALPETADTLLQEQSDAASVLVVMSDFYTRILDGGQAGRLLEKFEKNWCRFLLQGLRDNSVHSLRIITRKAEFNLNRRSLWKFWSKVNSLDQFTT